jgi:hypothetical protein
MLNLLMEANSPELSTSQMGSTISCLAAIITSQFSPRIKELLEIQHDKDPAGARLAQHRILEELSLLLCETTTPKLSAADARKAEQIGAFYFAPSTIILEALYDKVKKQLGFNYSLPAHRNSLPCFGKACCESQVIKAVVPLISKGNEELLRQR